MELAGGFAREVNGAVEVAGVELAKGEFEEDAGFSEAGGSFEKNEWVAFEGRGEVALSGFLAGTRGREGGTKTKATEALAGAQTEVEEFSNSLELGAEQGVVGERERDSLGEPAGGFDEEELGAERGLLSVRVGCEAEAPEIRVGGELDEVFGVVAAEFGFVDGERARDGFDFTESGRSARRWMIVT